MQWYVNQNGKTTGPFSEQRVTMLVNWGKISSDAYLCDDQWACWVSVGRSQFAPLLPNYDPEQRPSLNARALSEPPAQGKVGHRLALALLLMLTAAAFLLALWLSPGSVVSGAPLGQADGASQLAPASAADVCAHATAGRSQSTTRDAERA